MAAITEGGGIVNTYLNIVANGIYIHDCRLFIVLGLIILFIVIFNYLKKNRFESLVPFWFPVKGNRLSSNVRDP